MWPFYIFPSLVDNKVYDKIRGFIQYISEVLHGIGIMWSTNLWVNILRCLAKFQGCRANINARLVLLVGCIANIVILKTVKSISLPS